MKQFNDLDNYVNCWPVDDLLKSRLKITSAKWRREQHLKEGDLAKEQAKRLKKKVKKSKTSKVGCIFFAVHSIPDPRTQV